MMMSIRRLLFSSLILCCLVIFAESCSCIWSHPQNQYCKADFVIRARVKGPPIIVNRKDNESGNNIPPMMPYKRYTIKIKRIYKGEDALKNVNRQYLITATDSAACGVVLQPGKKYVIMGTIRNGLMHTYSCEYVRDWSTLKRNEIKLFKAYGKQCNQCEVKACQGTNCEAEKDKCMCSWDQRHHASECYLKAVCKKRKGTCRWAKNRAFSACYEEECNKSS